MIKNVTRLKWYIKDAKVKRSHCLQFTRKSHMVVAWKNWLPLYENRKGYSSHQKWSDHLLHCAPAKHGKSPKLLLIKSKDSRLYLMQFFAIFKDLSFAGGRCLLWFIKVIVFTINCHQFHWIANFWDVQVKQKSSRSSSKNQTKKLQSFFEYIRFLLKNILSDLWQWGRQFSDIIFSLMFELMSSFD